MALAWTSPRVSSRNGAKDELHIPRFFSMRSLGCLLVICLAATTAFGQVSVPTYQYNNQRTGVNSHETTLTPANVNSTAFGKLFSQTVDGDIYGQPLYVANLTVNGAVHNVVYVATENDSVYAFDADSNGGANAQPLWHTSFLSAGVTTVSDNNCSDIAPVYGITGTPVIDLSTNTLYVVAETLEGGTNFVKKLHALDITTGLEKQGSPTVITASVTVPGQNPVTIDTLWANQRAGLLFYNGVVYIALGSHCDGGDWRGWILGYSYNGSALNQVFVFSTEPSSVNGAGGGIWMSGQGLPMDSGSNLFVGTGNGQFDTNVTPPINYGDSILRIDLSKGPTVQDYYTPSIQGTLDSQNQDLGSGGIAILPDQPGPNPHLAITADKYQTIYVVNRDNLGQFSSNSDNVVQHLGFGAASMFSTPIYFNGKVYFSGSNDVVRAYTMTNGMLSNTSTDNAPDLFKFPGSVPTISANGTSNAILWTLESHGSNSGASAILFAYDPTNLAGGSLYNSNQNLTRDNPGGAIKFAVPIVANGKVYVGSAGQLSVYGELSSSPQVATPQISPASESFTGSVSVSITDTTPGATISYTTDGSIPPSSPTSQTYLAPFNVTATTVVNAVGTETGYLTSALSTANYTLQGTPTILSLSPSSGPAGTSVTISGTNFGATQGASSVAFNGTAATATSWSTTSITATVPATATTGNLVVTVAGVASNGMTFTVTGSVPPPVISSISPSSGPIGTAVTINGTNFGSTQGTSTITFNGTAATATIWNATTITATVPTGATSGAVVVAVNGVASNGITFTITSICGENSQTGTDSQNGNWAFASPCVTGNNANGYTPSSIQYWVGSPASTTFDLGIYGDNGGAAGTLLCHTGTSTISVSAGWNNVSLAGNGCPTLNASTRYWIGYITGSNTIQQGTITGVCPNTSLNSVYASNQLGSTLLSTTFGATSGTPFCYSMYLVLFNNQSGGPTINSLSPSSGGVGTAVTIAGANFGSTQGTSTVTFNGVAATVTGWAATSIAATVPNGATTGNVVVTVGGVASNGASFAVTFPPPTISSLNPGSGPVGSSVTITGTNFGSTQGTSTVTFNGTAAMVTAWSPASITATVPNGAATGNVVVTVGGTASNGISFNVTLPPPSITSLNPASGSVGTAVTINGANFGSSQGSSTVTFNGTTASVTSWAAGSISTTVPSGATTGNVVVTVGGAASNAVNFTVTVPTITTLNPASGIVGTAVTINGSSFGSVQGTSTVTFNGTSATTTSWSAGSISTTVPGGALTGNVVVTVGGVASNGVSFTVTVPPPVINSLNPATGPVSTPVTINGTNFGPTQGTSTVTFNNTVATATSWSATSISTTVPSGATTGNVVVTVGGVASNGANFTVGSLSGPTISTLTPASGPVGVAVTISGTNFGPTQLTSTITFNGTGAAATSWSPTSITAAVPAGATTGSVVVTVGGVQSNGVTFTVTTPPTISSLNPASGAIGTAVTIAGANFGSTQGPSTVKFNGTTATVTSWSPTSITATVPTAATTGNVVVTVGGTPSNGVNFTLTSTCGETGQAGTDSQNANWAFASPCVTGNDANGYTVTSLKYWVGNPASNSFDLGIYADNAGSPGSLLCHTGTTTINVTAGWNTISLAGKGCPTLNASTRYWIGYITGSNTIQQGTVNSVCPNTTLNGVYASNQLGSALLSNSFGATSGTPFCYSMYLVLNNK